VDEMNHEFQALALESRGMGEVIIEGWKYNWWFGNVDTI